VTETDFKNILPQNIISYRKALDLTQAELAAKLNYSDKAVSKWERGEAVPDVVVLNQMAALFGVSLDTLCSGRTLKKSSGAPFSRKQLLISLMSAGLVWLVSTLLYIFLSMGLPDASCLWMTFVCAIPCTAIVLIVFNAIWGKKIIEFFLVSILSWSVALCLFLSVPHDKNYLFFIGAVPMQILICLWHLMFIKCRKKIKQGS